MFCPEETSKNICLTRSSMVGILNVNTHSLCSHHLLSFVALSWLVRSDKVARFWTVAAVVIIIHILKITLALLQTLTVHFTISVHDRFATFKHTCHCRPDKLTLSLQFWNIIYFTLLNASLLFFNLNVTRVTDEPKRPKWIRSAPLRSRQKKNGLIVWQICFMFISQTWSASL